MPDSPTPAPTPVQPPVWFHTTSPLNGRLAPGGPVRYVRPVGYNFRAGGRITAAGRDWLVSTKGTFYAAEFCSAGKAARKPPSPVPGYRSTTPWRKRPNDRTYWQARGYHTGTDWAAPTGAAVVAVNAGTVVRYSDRVLGTIALLQYRDAAGRKFTRWYCHLSAITTTGKVRAGDEIGRVGHSGTGAAMGPHLHLERRAGWTTSWSGPDLDPTTGWALP